MKLIKYKPEYQKIFEQLNRAWVEKYFQMELKDEEVILNPEATILKKGGQIYFVEHQGRLIGTVALIFVSKGVYEMAKMAVDEAFQGIGAGKFLCYTAILEARRINAHKLILFTNSSLKPAIGIYKKFGFKKVFLEGQEYSRADTKMELLLKPDTEINWFDRKFDFNLSLEEFPNLLERLKKTSSKIPVITNGLSEPVLNFKPDGKWSIKEHIGHLWLLEPLWQERFLEIKDSHPNMSPADLTNSATDRAFFNQYKMGDIMGLFQQERIQTVRLLENLNREELLNSINHPRLNQPMRIIDLMFFVAEHDEHHLNAVLKIFNT